MDFIREKIRVMCGKLDALRTVKSENLEFAYIPCGYKKGNVPPREDDSWSRSDGNLALYGLDNHFWFHLKLEPQTPTPGTELRLQLKTGKEGQWDACNPQGLVYLNGKAVQALDVNHTWVSLEYNMAYDLYIYFYTGNFYKGIKDVNFHVHMYLTEVNLSVEKLYYDLNVPFCALQALDESSYDYIKIRDCLDKALLLLDLRDVHSDEFYKSVMEVSAYLEKEFYNGVCQNTSGAVSCLGHTHIDIAWLWTVAQTREKAQRSFATALYLMDRYPNYVFMSSQPQLYQFVKEEDPDMYARIKQRVREGRWEVDGAMWLEADCNLISGESMVRQVLYGKKFMRDEFGVESKMLWLPDVFGYSAALPQIMKKCNVDMFFTAKLSWNETNEFPYSSFIWEGIDGTEMFSSVISAYVNDLTPITVKDYWDSFKSKSYSDSALMTVGYGDGGGGTTVEMMENYNRLHKGLPGLPKPVMQRAADYFGTAKVEFETRAAELKKTPRWVGELYLEMHRGTYTSMAKNKKNNRKSELALMEAEGIASMAYVFGLGAYPSAALQDIQMTMLLNQFHDIIPGSSIKEVYDVTDKEYGQILKDLEQISDSNLRKIAAGIQTDGGILIYNPAPFAVSDTAAAGNIRVEAPEIPAHGWRVVPERAADCKVAVSDKVLENRLIRVEFDENYEIKSIFDKEADREVLAQNETANRLEVYEDYPREYDAWEITDYYKQKMWPLRDVSAVSVTEDGIKIVRSYMHSTVEQTIRLGNNTKRIDFCTTVDWHEDHVLLKAVFPVDVHAHNATYEIQFGNVERPTHANTGWDAARFEVCAHKWADLSECGYGVSLLNNCKYGHSILGNVMTVSLLKAATYPNPEADRGLHTFTYSLFPHCGDYREGGTIQEAYKLNMPLRTIKLHKQNGTYGETYSLASTDQSNAVLETVKKEEEGNNIVVRLYEAHNKKSLTTVTVGFDFKEVYLCNLLEEPLERLEHSGRSVRIKLHNFEIVTLKYIL